MMDLFFAGSVLADAVQNVTSLLCSAYRSQVSWTIREHFDAGGKKQCREALKGKQEPPSHIRVPVVDESEPKRDPVRDGNSQV